ncbi:MAG TPA: BACON domain-containing protein, partial [Vicinamibacterales bacterium]|nr:BACON domain-containing protein [Vicinamibacterales bacterium]
GYRSMRRSRLAASVAALLWPALVSAQTLDPQRAEFDPSADHDAVVDGQPVVSRYVLEFYLVGAAQPFQTGDMGKPAPDPDGKIRVSLLAVLGALPSPGIVYEARVAAIGPGGTSRSEPSNQFMFSSPCTATLSPTSASVGSIATTGSVAVSAPAGCAWTATSAVSWITITSGASGTGSGTVGYSVAANPSTTSRTGSLTIAGRTFTVAQAGASCAFTISPTSANIGAAGGSGSVAVSTTAGCAWTATSAVSWITITSGASGTGSGTVGYSVAPNASGSSRTGTLAIAGRTFTLTQPGASAPQAPRGLRILR